MTWQAISARPWLGARAFVAGHAVPLRLFIDAFMMEEDGSGGGGGGLFQVEFRYSQIV